MRSALVFACVLASASPASAQTDWRSELRASLVRVSAGKMVSDESSMMKIAIPGYERAYLQVKIHAEAPAAGVISRDNFVALTSTISTLTLLTAFAQAYNVSASTFLTHYDVETLANPIGKADVELNLFMTDEGFQLEVVNNNSGTKNRVTHTWKQMYSTT